MDIHTFSPQDSWNIFFSWLFKSPSISVQSLLALSSQLSHSLPPPFCPPFPNQRALARASLHSLPHTHPAGLCPMPHPSLHDLASLPVVPPFRVWISTHQSSFSSPCLDLGLSGDSGKQKTTDVASCLVVFRPRRKGLLLIQPRTSSTHSHHPQELCSPLLSRFSWNSRRLNLTTSPQAHPVSLEHLKGSTEKTWRSCQKTFIFFLPSV